MSFVRFVFKKKSGSIVEVTVEREEHNRLMAVMDFFLPGNQRPVMGLMYVNTADNDAMFINLAELEDVSVIYPR